MNEKIQSILYVLVILVIFVLPPLLKYLERIFLKGSPEENGDPALHQEEMMDDYPDEEILRRGRKTYPREHTEIDSRPIKPRWW